MEESVESRGYAGSPTSDLGIARAGGYVDWYLPNVAGAASVLRKDIAGYVRRHAQEGSDILGAELICAELINNAIENSDSPVWVSLDWGRDDPSWL